MGSLIFCTVYKMTLHVERNTKKKYTKHNAEDNEKIENRLFLLKITSC